MNFRNDPYKNRYPNAHRKSTGPKQSIDSTGDPNAGNFILLITLSIFKKFVFAPTHIKIGLYCFALVVCSLIRDFNLIGHNLYFAQKNNIFNVYFVKLGWFWTLLICTPFILMTSIVYTGFNKMFIRNNLARLLVATVMWYFFTTVFDKIDQKTGQCAKASIRTKHECKLSKHEWLNGFDISGHTFILMYALFIMIEEVKIYTKWEQIRKKLNELAKNDDFTPSTEKAYYWYNLLTPYIKLNFIMMALLVLLWEIMLLSTFLFFHTIMHKLIAASIAIIAWFVTYRVWYSDSMMFMSPGLPGNGIEKISL